MSCSFHIGVNGNGSKGVLCKSTGRREFIHTHVSVAVEGEVRREGLNTVGAGINVFTFGTAVVFVVEVAVLVKNFSEGQRNLFSCFGIYRENRIANKILTEVDNCLAFWCLMIFFGEKRSISRTISPSCSIISSLISSG